MSEPTPGSTGTLYLVPNTLDLGTPDSGADLQALLPLGVIRIAAGLQHWVAENAKSTRAFLKRVDAVVPLVLPLQSLCIVELPRAQKGAPLKGAAPNLPSAMAPQASLQPLLAPAQHGHDVGLISEAGLPAVADPGAALVQAAHGLGIRVMALPGASSLLLALAASGLNGQSFAFIGYLPVDAAERATRIRDLEALSRRQRQTQLMIETPYRNEALLGALVAHLQATTQLSVSCGLTLAGGFTRSDTVAAWRARATTMPGDVPAVFSLLAG
ncbi:MAG: uroporphyrin-III methyltransferase [Methylibium sp. NZG]|nr:MAG: uroporphyrin-III methyltransferase [Methylibium sp. NZG]